MTFGNNLKSVWAEVYGTNPDPLQSGQYIFSKIISHFDLHTSYQRIASFYGKKENGNGFGFNAVTPYRVGDGAFAVYRTLNAQTTYDIAICFNHANVWPSGAFTFDGGGITSAIGIQISCHSSSQAWSGTTANNGTDSFVTNSVQPWKSGSLVFPRTNAADGAYAATRADATTVYDFVGFSYNSQIIISTDDEGTFIGKSDGENQNKIKTPIYFGGYNKLSGSGYNAPLTILNLNDPNAVSISIVSQSGGPGVKTGLLDGFYTTFGSERDDKYNEEDREKFEEHPLLVLMNDTTYQYFCGNIPMIKSIPESTARFNFYNNRSRLVFYKGSYGGANDGAYSVMWESSSYKEIS